MNSTKIALIGAGGARTPLLIHGLAHAQRILNTGELALYDIDRAGVELMARMGREIINEAGAGFRITTPSRAEEAIKDARFVLSSIRVGGMRARARDERISMEHGMTGQETTGAGGLAMALRTVPVALAYARLIEEHAPEAWLINFTNPAGLITQALRSHTNVRAIGICDTPAELFHRIAWSLGLPYEEMEFDYCGLNHLGWVRRVRHRGRDITERLLGDDEALLRLYPAPLFEPELLRTLRLIPTEYVFFVYSKTRAWENQKKAGASRGEELLELNSRLFGQMQQAPREALGVYKSYLNQRNASYLKLEGEAGTALREEQHDWDPFEGVTGYHRIALDVMTALLSTEPKNVVVNVRNESAVPDLRPDDVVEVPSLLDSNGARPLAAGALPDAVSGLVLAVKQYERLAISAAVRGSFDLARLALLTYPIAGEWEPASRVLRALVDADPEYLGYLH